MTVSGTVHIDQQFAIEDAMKCTKCGTEINNLNHYVIPLKNRKEGMRYCFKCAKEEHVITLV